MGVSTKWLEALPGAVAADPAADVGSNTCRTGVASSSVNGASRMGQSRKVLAAVPGAAVANTVVSSTEMLEAAPIAIGADTAADGDVSEELAEIG